MATVDNLKILDRKTFIEAMDELEERLAEYTSKRYKAGLANYDEESYDYINEINEYDITVHTSSYYRGETDYGSYTVTWDEILTPELDDERFNSLIKEQEKKKEEKRKLQAELEKQKELAEFERLKKKYNL